MINWFCSITHRLPEYPFKCLVPLYHQASLGIYYISIDTVCRVMTVMHISRHTTTSFLIRSTLTMSCSAQSNPQAEFQWAFNGNQLNGTNPDLKLYSAVESQSGLSSCLAFNNRTMSYINVTRQITISCGSVSVQLGVSVWLLLLLSSLARVLIWTSMDKQVSQTKKCI